MRKPKSMHLIIKQIKTHYIDEDYLDKEHIFMVNSTSYCGKVSEINIPFTHTIKKGLPDEIIITYKNVHHVKKI